MYFSEDGFQNLRLYQASIWRLIDETSMLSVVVSVFIDISL